MLREKSYAEVKRKCDLDGRHRFSCEGMVAEARFGPTNNTAQVFSKFDKQKIRSVLDNFGVKKKESVVVIAGFTGHFARSVQASGNNVIFTDIDKRWVDKAKRGEQLSKEGKWEKAKPLKGVVMNAMSPHIDDRKVSAVMGFEPTPLVRFPVVSTIAPNLGSKNGLILVNKRESPFNLQESVGFRDPLFEFLKEYNVDKKQHKEGDLNFLQFKIPEKHMQKYLMDRECFESVENKGEKISEISKRLGISEKEALEAYKRYNKFSYKL